VRPGARSVGPDWMKYEYGRAVYVGVSYWTGKTPLGLLRCVFSFLFFSLILNYLVFELATKFIFNKG
jgi:hypothetical protein